MEPQDESHEILRKAHHIDSDDEEYKDYRHIEVRDRLIQYPQIQHLIALMLDMARAGGLSKVNCDGIFDQLIDAYGNLRGDSFFSLRDGLIHTLVEDDYDAEKSDENEFKPRFGGGNKPESLN